jgi:putative endonuclease
VPRVTARRQRLGRYGEALVARRLAAEGWSIVARNARVKGVRGELDVVAIDGSTLVFVEVKSRSAGSTRGPEAPAMAVDRRKQVKIRSLALAWLRENRGRLGGFAHLRFDVVGLRVDGAGRVREHNHIRGAF